MKPKAQNSQMLKKLGQMSFDNLEMSYAEAISRASVDAARQNERLVFLGIGVQYPSGIFGTTNELYRIFGGNRVIDTPAMENGLTGIAVGLCRTGHKPVVIHARSDFMLLAFDPIINLIAKWNYMFGGEAGKADVVIRSIIGKGWGQGATHSQSFHSLLGHIPGIRVLLPSTVQDAYSMTYASLMDQIPTVIFEHRSLYSTKSKIHIGESKVDLQTPRRLIEGTHITLAGYSYATYQLVKASEALKKYAITADVFDLRSLNLDNVDDLRSSVQKTKKVLLHDVSWVPYGASSEIVSRLFEGNLETRGIDVNRVGNFFSPAPTSEFLENQFYPSVEDIVKICLKMLGKNSESISSSKDQDSMEFLGPY